MAVAAGPPSDVASARMVEDVFGVAAVVIDDPVSGAPLVVPAGDRSDRAAGVTSR